MGIFSSPTFEIFEVNENHKVSTQRKFARDLDDLEQYVSNNLDKDGRKDEFFPTGYEDVLDYINDRDVTVVVCQYNNEKIISGSYVTQGQGLYTYNDLSKYFKFNKEYVEYAKTKYDPKELCSIMYETFMKKIRGYKYAKEKIAKELSVNDVLNHCKIEKEKGIFDERNKVREKVNRYIYDYFNENNNENDKIGFKELDRFYLLKFSDLENCGDNSIKIKCQNETEENKTLYKEYGELLDLFDLNSSILPDGNGFTYLKPDGFKKYFDANPFNTIELDTCIIHPENGRIGLVKVVTFEGLKIQLDKLLKKRPELEQIYISATIHQNNEPSKRVTKFFGNFDTLYIKRRIDIKDNNKKDINREVYFCKIEKKELYEFYRKIEQKIKKLLDYNDNKPIFTFI